MIDKLDIFDIADNNTRSFIHDMKTGSVEILPNPSLTHYKKEPCFDDINKLKIYPQPPVKNPVVISKCGSNKPNYAKEAREAAEAAASSAALAKQYAEEAQQAAVDLLLQSTLEDDTLILYLEVL